MEEKVDHRQLGDTLAPAKGDAAGCLLPREPNQHVLQVVSLAAFGLINNHVGSEPLAVGWNGLPALRVRHTPPPLQHRNSPERRGTPIGWSVRTRSAVVLIAVRIDGWSSKLNGSASS